MGKTLSAAFFLIFFLAGCGVLLNWGEPITDVISPSPPSETAPPSSAPWAISDKKPHSGMFGIAWDPTDKLSPLLTANRVNREMYCLIYDSLFVLDGSFMPHESLCESLYTEDNRRFLITLRQGVVFHNGQPLTAQDVVTSFQTARSPASPYSNRFSKVENVIQSDGKVEVTLREPNDRFAALLTFPIVKAGDPSFPPAGTGPYMPGNEEGRNYLAAFSDWWRHETLPVGHIELNAVDKLEDITYLMSVGDVSIVTSDLNDSFGIGFNGDFDVWDYPTPTMYYVGFNLSHPMLSDKRVRQAISCAFDRSGLVSSVFKNAADPATAAVPPALYDSGDGYDLVRYTELVTSAGLADTNNDGILDYASGRGRTPFELRFIADEEDSAACEASEFLAKTLRTLGIAVKVEALPKAQLAADINNKAYGLYCARITLAADFQLSRWGKTATGTSIDAQNETFLDGNPIAPLLFKRARALTHFSEVTGIKPVYGNPYVNIWEWTVAQ